MKLTTSITNIRDNHPCTNGYKKLVNNLAAIDRNAKFDVLAVLESNGVVDLLWALRATNENSKALAIKIVIEFAKLALPIFEARMPGDSRAHTAIAAAEDYLAGYITAEECYAMHHKCLILYKLINTTAERAAFSASSVASTAAYLAILGDNAADRISDMAIDAAETTISAFVNHIAASAGNLSHSFYIRNRTLAQEMEIVKRILA